MYFLNQSTEAPGGARELAAGEGLPVPANKRNGAAVELTWRRLGVVVASGRTPASSGGEAAAGATRIPARCGGMRGN
jgi:hypothetical protein